MSSTGFPRFKPRELALKVRPGSSYSTSSSSSSPSRSSFYESCPSSASSHTSLSSTCSIPCSGSSRPLPAPPSSACSSSHPRQLPSPPTADSASGRLPASSSARNPCAPSNSSKASLGLDTPSPSNELKFVIPPVAPLSPISFTFPGPKMLRRKRENELARRMKDMGFVETPPAQATRSASPCPSSAPAGQEMVLLVDSSDEGKEEREEKTVELEVNVHVIVDTKRIHRRYSRKWIREAKGKRWVETDYQQVLSSLRQLR